MLSPQRLGLLAWCEGLDQMASHRRAVRHVGRQYVEGAHILFFFSFYVYLAAKSAHGEPEAVAGST